MHRMWITSVALLFAAYSAVVGAEAKSGLQVGDEVAAFDVTDVTGPSKGKTLCYRCQYGNRPVVGIFTRDVNDNVAALAKQIDEQLTKNEDQKMAAFVVVLSDDPKSAAAKLEEVAKKQEIDNVPLTTFENKQGPSEYKIASDSDVTVIMWRRGEVKANHALKKGELNADAIKRLVADTSKILK